MAGRVTVPGKAAPWDVTVERLLSVTYGDLFHHRATLGPHPQPRGVTAFALLDAANWSLAGQSIWGGAGGRPPFDKAELREAHEAPRGMSLIHLQVSD